jgi:hypothetical protein
MENGKTVIGAVAPAQVPPQKDVRVLSRKLIAAVIAGIATVAGLSANINTVADLFTPSVAGQWQLTTTTRAASVGRFINLPLTYTIELTQTDRTISGRGYKIRENGNELPPAQQQPIEITGEIIGSSLSAQYLLKPGSNKAARPTIGSFEWHIKRAGMLGTTASRLDGTFSAQAADSKGDAVAIRSRP